VLANGGDLLAGRMGLWIGADYGQKQEGEALRRCDMILHSCLDTDSIVGGKRPVGVVAPAGFAVLVPYLFATCG